MQFSYVCRKLFSSFYIFCIFLNFPIIKPFRLIIANMYTITEHTYSYMGIREAQNILKYPKFWATHCDCSWAIQFPYEPYIRSVDAIISLLVNNHSCLIYLGPRYFNLANVRTYLVHIYCVTCASEKKNVHYFWNYMIARTYVRVKHMENS